MNPVEFSSLPCSMWVANEMSAANGSMYLMTSLQLYLWLPWANTTRLLLLLLLLFIIIIMSRSPLPRVSKILGWLYQTCVRLVLRILRRIVWKKPSNYLSGLLHTQIFQPHQLSCFWTRFFIFVKKTNKQRFISCFLPSDLKCYLRQTQVDLLQKKISHNPVGAPKWSDYSGGADVKATSEYFLAKFLTIAHQVNKTVSFFSLWIACISSIIFWGDMVGWTDIFTYHLRHGCLQHTCCFLLLSWNFVESKSCCLWDAVNSVGGTQKNERWKISETK